MARTEVIQVDAILAIEQRQLVGDDPVRQESAPAPLNASSFSMAALVF